MISFRVLHHTVLLQASNPAVLVPKEFLHWYTILDIFFVTAKNVILTLSRAFLSIQNKRNIWMHFLV